MGEELQVRGDATKGTTEVLVPTPTEILANLLQLATAARRPGFSKKNPPLAQKQPRQY